MADYETISHEHARALLAADAVLPLDVRTPGEYEQLGHIPGAWLLPVDLVTSAPAVLPEGRPVLVYCEHGVRSAAASRLLAAAGLAPVYNLAAGMAAWTGDREFGPGSLRGPSDWLIEQADLLPRGGTVLDVACGRGRHALLLASAGFRVRAVDRDAAALAFLQATALRLGLPMECDLVDLEADTPPDLGRAGYDAVLVFNYLHRPLVPALHAALKPGGRLFYETFTVLQAERGHPRNPAYLLEPGELVSLAAPLHVLRSREGDVAGRAVASIVAERVA